MSFTIPNFESRSHSQTNRNDVSGSIFASKNINLDEEAYIKLSPASVAVMTTDDDADFDNADAMNGGEDELFINSDEVFSGSIGIDALTNRSGDTNSPSPSVEDDTIRFNDTQVVSDGTTIKYLSGASTWTTITGLTIAGSAPTSLALFDGQNALMIGHGNVVDLVDTSWSLDDTLVLPNEYKVSSMVSNGSVGYIATRHDASGEARLFIWDGSASSANESYGIENFEIASLKSADSSVVVFSADGRMLRFNGGGFDELAVLPVYMTDEIYGDEGNDYSKVSNRGMVVDGNQVFVQISSEIDTTKRYLQNMSGGVWCFDPAVGFYHRHAPSLTTFTKDIVATLDVDTSTDEITVTTAPVTGTPVLYDAGSGDVIGGLLEVTPYFVINVDATTIKLASSLDNALAGTAISLTSTGSDTQFLLLYSTFDYGQQYIPNRGAVAVLSSAFRNEKYSGRLAFSADARDETLSDKTTLSTYIKSLPNRGYFVLPRLYSGGKSDKYNYINIKHDDLSPHDQIIVKYKTSTPYQYPIDLTNFKDNAVTNLKGIWTDTNTFTTTQDLSQVSDGDEIEIIAGKGAGFLAHISSISESTGTYTVNLDEDFLFAEADDEFLFLVDNWQKLGTITADSLDDGFRIDKVGPYLHLKVELRGLETKVIDLMVNNQSYRSLI